MLTAEIKKKLLIIIMVSTVSAFSIATPLVIWSMNRGIPDPNWIPGYNIAYDDEVTFNFFENRTTERTIVSSNNYYGFSYGSNDFIGGFDDILDFSKINIVDILVNGSVDSGRCQGWNIEIIPNTFQFANLRLFDNYQNRSVHTIENTSLVFSPPSYWIASGLAETVKENIRKLFFPENSYYPEQCLHFSFKMHAEYPEYYTYPITLRPWFNLTFTVRFTYDEGYYPQEPKYENWVGLNLTKTYTDFEMPDIFIQGTRLYQTSNGGYLKIFDISDPMVIHLIGQYNNLNDFHPQEVIVNGSIAYLSNQGYGMVLLDVSNPNNIQEISRVTSVDGGPCVFRDNILYLSNGRCLTTINVTDAENPVVLDVNGSVNPFTARWMQFHNEYLYVGFGDNMAIYNVSDPSNIEELRYFNVSSPWYPGESWDIDYALIVGDLLYAANENLGTIIYNIANPNNLIMIDSIGLPAEKISLNGNYLYALNYHGITIIDVSNPYDMSLLNDYDFELSDHHSCHFLQYCDGVLLALEYYDDYLVHIFDTGYDGDNDGISDFNEAL